MRVTLMATYDTRGGAARAAYRLHSGLRALGHESAMLVKEKFSDDDAVHPLRLEARTDPQSWMLHLAQQHYVAPRRTSISNTYFSLNEPGYDLSSHPLVRQGEVLHLHWVAGFQSARAIVRLQRLPQPLVWTLHDQRPFTGGCHFSAGCEKYRQDCGQCPQLTDDPFQLTKAQLKTALRRLQATRWTVVCPSRWMARAAQQSALLRRARFEVIPYGVDTDRFCPLPKTAAKEKLGLNPRVTWLFFGADDGNEQRKGFRELTEALGLCARNPEFQARVQRREMALLCLGRPHPQLESLGLPVTALGFVSSDEVVSRAFAAADLFILPSREDNFPNTVLEAMSAGTPVVAFAAGGVPELVMEDQTGILAPAGDVRQLAQGILSLALAPARRERLGHNCRERILAGYSLAAQARRHVELYEELRGEAKAMAGLRCGCAAARPVAAPPPAAGSAGDRPAFDQPARWERRFRAVVAGIVLHCLRAQLVPKAALHQYFLRARQKRKFLWQLRFWSWWNPGRWFQPAPNPTRRAPSAQPPPDQAPA